MKVDDAKRTPETIQTANSSIKSSTQLLLSLLILRQDIEEDKELQSQIALYRNPNGRDGSGDEAMEVDSDEDGDEIDVALESLVDKTDVDTL